MPTTILSRVKALGKRRKCPWRRSKYISWRTKYVPVEDTVKDYCCSISDDTKQCSDEDSVQAIMASPIAGKREEWSTTWLHSNHDSQPPQETSCEDFDEDESMEWDPQCARQLCYPISSNTRAIESILLKADARQTKPATVSSNSKDTSLLSSKNLSCREGRGVTWDSPIENVKRFDTTQCSNEWRSSPLKAAPVTLVTICPTSHDCVSPFPHGDATDRSFGSAHSNNENKKRDSLDYTKHKRNTRELLQRKLREIIPAPSDNSSLDEDDSSVCADSSGANVSSNHNEVDPDFELNFYDRMRIIFCPSDDSGDSNDSDHCESPRAIDPFQWQFHDANPVYPQGQKRRTCLEWNHKEQKKWNMAVRLWTVLLVFSCLSGHGSQVVDRLVVRPVHNAMTSAYTHQHSPRLGYTSKTIYSDSGPFLDRRQNTVGVWLG